MIERIKKNYFEMIKDYDQKSKSDHWIKMFSKNNFEKFNLENFRKRNLRGISLSYGMEDWLNFYDTLQELMGLLKILPPDEIKNLVDVRVGNPDYYSFGNLKINYNEISILKQFLKINKYLNSEQKLICEIGGGFGSLASKIKKIYPDKTMILIDLPETLVLQTYYLSTLFPKQNFCLYDDLNNLDFDKIKNNSFDFILLPPWSINKLSKKFSIDFFINSRSMMEMDKKVIKDYFNFIHEMIRVNGIFYCLNKKEKMINNTPIRIAEYPYDNKWEVKQCEQAENPNMYEIITKRTDLENLNFQKILKSLDKKNSQIITKNFTYYIKKTLRIILDSIMVFVPKSLILKIFKIYY